jgi:integrase
MTGLRMGELLALRWRDVDFAAQTVRVTASYTVGKLGTSKSGLGRAVPLVQGVAEILARLGNRERWAGPDDLVFVGQTGECLDGSALRRRFKRARDSAGLHDLRHTFGSVAIRTVDPCELQEWMGHSDFSTTQIYMHYRPRTDAARRLSAAFGRSTGTRARGAKMPHGGDLEGQSGGDMRWVRRAIATNSTLTPSSTFAS